MTEEKKNERIGRRVFLHRGGALLGGTALLSTLAACGGGEEQLSCATPAGLTPQHTQMRTTMSYQEHGTDPAKLCKDCNFYPNPPPMDSCGNCTLNLGPVNPMGTCTGWAARA